MERWEDQIDVDDSDLYSVLHPHSLPSCPSSSQTPPLSLHPCSQIPSLQTLDRNHPPPSESQRPVAVHETNRTEEQKNLPNASTARPLIPGPAGAIQTAMRRQSAFAAEKYSPLEEGEGDDWDICAREEQEEDFKLNPWLCALSSLGARSYLSLSHPISLINANDSCIERIPQVVGVIKHCRKNGLGDLFVTLKDPTGTISATVHGKVLSEGNASREISVGCVLILNQVAAFHPPRSQCYLNITLKNVVKLISNDCGPPEKQIASPFADMHGLEGNGKQLQTKLHADDGSCNARTTVSVESRKKNIGDRMMDSSKTSLPESSSSKIFAAAASETVKSGTCANESKRFISQASVAEWTDEQLEQLFSEYDDDFELGHHAT